MTNDKTASIDASDAERIRALERRIAVIEAEAKVEAVEAEAEADDIEWADFEEEEPDDRDDVKVLERIEKALPDGHVLQWAHDGDGNLITQTGVVPDDDDDDDDDDDE